MKSKTIWVLLLALAGCFGYLGVRKLVKSVPQPPQPSKKLFATTLETITSVTIIPSGGQLQKFIKEGDQWQIEEPLAVNASQWPVESLTSDICDMQYARKYSQSDRNRPTNELTGVDKPRYTVMLENAEGKTEILLVGNDLPLSGGEKVYAALGGRADVFVIEMNLAKKFSKPTSDYRDTTIIQLNREKILSVQVEGPQSWTLKKADDRWQVVIEGTLPANSDQADKIVAAIANVTCEKFVDDNPADLSIYGLDEDNAQMIVTVKAADIQTKTLIFGASRGDKVFAKLASQTPVFQLSTSVMETFKVDPAELAAEPQTQPDSTQENPAIAK